LRDRKVNCVQSKLEQFLLKFGIFGTNSMPLTFHVHPALRVLQNNVSRTYLTGNPRLPAKTQYFLGMPHESMAYIRYWWKYWCNRSVLKTSQSNEHGNIASKAEKLNILKNFQTTSR